MPPKHILILAIGSSGDVHPMIALAQGLHARGHRITFAVNPHFFPLLEKLGIPTAAVGTEEDYRSAMDHPELWNSAKALPFILKRFVAKAIEPIYQLVAENQPDLIVGTPLSLGARVAHDHLGIPYSSVVLAPATILSVDQPAALPGLSRKMPQWWTRGIYWLANRLMDRAVCPPLNEFRGRLGLRPVRDVIQHYWHSPQQVLCLFPEYFLSHGIPTDWPAVVRLTGFPLYDESDVTPLEPALEAFLAAGTPPIIFTPGSAMTQAADFFAASAAAVQSLGARALFLTRYDHQISKNLPATIAHFPFVPLSRVLPRSAALVCHGGIGTVSQGLAAGCPLLIMPMAHDQPDNAQRIMDLGAGLALPRKHYHPAAVARLLERLTREPAFRAAAERIAKLIAADRATALPRACDCLESLLDTKAPQEIAAFMP